jgi:class 3 adenylate cyclase/tetratricopeptide (TPR) repeat protein
MAAACAACGEANRPDARFCSSCGAALGATSPTDADGPAPAPATASDATSERRLVTVLFTDLVGFTTLAEDRDPEAVRELLSRYFATATDAIDRHGGTVEKFIGDAVMAVWGTPVAHEDDAERAVRAGLEIVDAVAVLQAGLKARAGILTGEAAVTLGATNQGMVAGDLVNTAARLQGVAEAGTVLVGEATRRAAERAIVFEPIGEHTLKGKTSPVPAWRAMRVVAQRGGQGRADALEPPFVGRDEELRQLKEVLHAVGREARPRLVSITGPGGIGKSRLVWELEKYIDGVAEDIYWHRGRSPSYGDGIAFWALGEMIRRRAGLTEDDDEATTRARITATLDEYIADADERERIGPALLSLLGVEDAPAGGRDALFPAWRLFFERIAERGTTVLVFEDLQWADAGLLDFIDHLLDWSRGLPIMVVTLARPEIFDRRPDWGAGRRQLTALALEPLTDQAVRELLEGLVPGLPADALAAIVGRAEGVPLYAVEMVRGLLADGLVERRGETYAVVGDMSRLRVPDSLRSLIASRLDALEPDDRALLQDAAVLGQVFSADSLAAITGTDAEALTLRLRDLGRRELVDVETDPRSPERGQYRFVQSLIREVAYGTLARRDRRSRHLAVARHYESLGDDELAGALASHYLSAHEASDEGAEADAIAAQARIALAAAAQRAAGLGAHAQAIRHLEQALAITTDSRERATLLDRAATSATAAALPDARRYAEAAIEACRETGDGTAGAAATVRLARVLLDASEITGAIETLETLVPEAEALGDPEILAGLFANLSRAHMRMGEPEAAIAAADRALSLAERENLDLVVAEALGNKASSLSQLGRRRESLALYEAALAIATSVDRPLELRLRNNFSSGLADDDPRRAIEVLRETIEIARDIGDRGIYDWQIGNVAAYCWSTGDDWDGILVQLRDAYEITDLRTDRLRLRALMGLIELEQGDEASVIVDEIRDLVGDSEEPDARFSLSITIAHAACIAGDYGRAYSEASELARSPTQNPEVPAGVALRAAVGAIDPDRIRDAADLYASLRYSGAWSAANRRMSEAAVAAIEGRTAEGKAGLLHAYAELERLGLHLESALAAVNAVTLLPDDPDIRAIALSARAVVERVGARPLLAQLDRALGAGSPQAGQRQQVASAEVAAE